MIKATYWVFTSSPVDLELNRDFNGDDYEYEDEAKLVIFPDHFEIPLPNIEELPALVSELPLHGSLCLFCWSFSFFLSLHADGRGALSGSSGSTQAGPSCLDAPGLLFLGRSQCLTDVFGIFNQVNPPSFFIREPLDAYTFQSFTFS